MLAKLVTANFCLPNICRVIFATIYHTKLDKQYTAHFANSRNAQTQVTRRNMWSNLPKNLDKWWQKCLINDLENVHYSAQLQGGLADDTRSNIRFMKYS